MVKVECAWCGKELLRRPYRLKRTPNQFCCREHRIEKKLFGKTTYRFVWESQCIDLFNSALEYPDFIAQKTFPWLKNYNNGKSRPGSLRVDVFYPRYNLCVEFDGEGHFQEINWKKGGDDTLQKVRERDELKTKLIEEHGLHLIRFRYDEPMTTEYVKKRLENYI